MHASSNYRSPAPPLARPAPLAVRVAAATGFSPAFWVAVAGCSLLSMALLAGRMWRTGQAGHMSLVWDVFLGWVPLAPALWAYRMSGRPGAVTRRRRAAIVALLAWWLLFFPNAPYLVTEFVHLHEHYGPSQSPNPYWLRTTVFPPPDRPHPSPGWYEFLLMAAVAAAGLALTLASFRLAQRTIGRLAGRAAAARLAPFLLILTGFGIGLGRFARLNSWDVFSNPVEAVADIAQSAVNFKTVLTAAVVAALLVLANVIVTESGRAERDADGPE